MVGQCSLTTAIVLMSFGCARGGSLWCYACNTDLRDGHTTECNDPYNPTPHFDLVLCPQNDSHHCLKSLITYRDVLVTVRGCVPSREIDGYCQHEEHFPNSSITCSFCNDYACNGQGSYHLFVSQQLGLVLLLISVSALFE
ncbi:uncharacterized protein LOC128876126 [Hylaeus volcanicus]|uniref:uncharacterized protein LOC128876126 n=1 Tax=Hylaeus volcanicus TaxID=313075 RepID=UPI0023B8108B|nr:uncharacterized protein LOC128876126 [Hylaeus volcanicus]